MKKKCLSPRDFYCFGLCLWVSSWEQLIRVTNTGNQRYLLPNFFGVEITGVLCGSIIRQERVSNFTILVHFPTISRFENDFRICLLANESACIDSFKKAQWKTGRWIASHLHPKDFELSWRPKMMFIQNFYKELVHFNFFSQLKSKHFWFLPYFCTPWKGNALFKGI